MITLLSVAIVLAFCSGVRLGIRIEREQTKIYAEHWDGTYLSHGYKHRAGAHR